MSKGGVGLGAYSEKQPPNKFVVTPHRETQASS